MDSSSVLADFINTYKPLINDTLATQLKDDVNQKQLLSSMQYSLMAGGKRLRPLLTIAVIKMVNNTITDDQLRATCALELIHTYSLIHDDLPAMDDDDLRRGKPTNHVKFGAGLATLAGDGLLTLAFQWITDNNLPNDVKARLALLLAQSAGPSGMVAGQANDILNENKKLTLDRLKQLHKEKTGALINYAMISGAVMSHVDDQLYSLLSDFGDNYGLAFQIYDDILDVTSSVAELGKPVNQDINKNTYTNLLGLDKSYELLDTLLEQSRMILEHINAKYDMDVSVLKAFLNYFKH
jgi:geranylgeranyl diphosphate synthase, type II